MRSTRIILNNFSKQSQKFSQPFLKTSHAPKIVTQTRNFSYRCCNNESAIPYIAYTAGLIIAFSFYQSSRGPGYPRFSSSQKTTSVPTTSNNSKIDSRLTGVK